MRLFIAVPLPNNIKRNLIKCIKDLDLPGVIPVNEDKLHITLRFLGDVDLDYAKSLLDQDFSSTECVVRSVGAFPNMNFIRVVWAGAFGLENLAKTVGAEDFKGHVTLARVKKKCDLSGFFEKYRSTSFGSFHVSKIVLMNSTLAKPTSIYSVVKEVYV